MEELEQDIISLKYSKQKMKELLLVLREVESFKDEEYKQLGNIEESTSDLLTQKELELEKLKGE